MTDQTDRVEGPKTAPDMVRIEGDIEEGLEMRCYRSRRILRDHHQGNMVEMKKVGHIQGVGGEGVE
jgi:hypothetical protein